MDLKTTDPAIVDLLNWLKENLPENVDEEYIFKKVHRVQKVFDALMRLSFETFYSHALNKHIQRKSHDEEVGRSDGENQRSTSTEPDEEDDNEEEDEEDGANKDREEASNNCSKSMSSAKPSHAEILSLEELVTFKLDEMKEYINLNAEKQLKTNKLDASTAQLDLKKEHYKLITSIRLDGCRDLISRYNRLMSKK